MTVETGALDDTDAVIETLLESFAAAQGFAEPYPHALLSRVLPAAIAEELAELPFEAAGVGGVSGKRELHNDTRVYFDKATCARLPACAAVAAAFQSDEVVGGVEAAFGARLAGTFVRIEYAQDLDGFWLQPHTDLGVKRFTMLLYLADPSGQADLGTDIYAAPGRWAKRTPFVANTALVFVPGENTWHGLERRPIAGVRKSVIMNYVTDAWRERGQLSYPERPVLLS
ncbi:MAG TPA: 2OG-Fe(II) oxygenase [Caulobacteraceae bacterium]|nr:2OG-Fe(II) oxygenase [Caulobacteraceae bacterium]